MRRCRCSALVFILLTAVCAPAIQAQTYSAPSALYTFPSSGAFSYPQGRMLVGKDLKLYGLAYDGNTGNDTLFSVNELTGAFATLKEPEDSDVLLSNPVQGTDGYLYATGVGDLSGAGLFRWDPVANTVTVIPTGTAYSFQNVYAPVQGTDGNFYSLGLDSSQLLHVLKITTSGSVTSVASFPAGTRLSCSTAPLELTAGNFYGFASTCQSASTYYRIANGVEKALASVKDYPPLAYMVAGSDGDIYAAAGSETDTTNGAILEATTSTANEVYEFDGSNDPFYTQYGLTSSSDGSLYFSSGTVFNVDSGYSGIGRFTLAGEEQPIAETSSSAVLAGITGGVTQGLGGYYVPVSPSSTENGGAIVGITETPAPPPAVQMSFDQTAINPGGSATLTWSVTNGFSATMQQCAAFQLFDDAGTTPVSGWSGVQAGAVTDGIYGNKVTLQFPNAGSYNFELTCGGIETGAASITVNQVLQSSATTLSISPATVAEGAPFTLTVKVTPASGGKTIPTGQFQMYVTGPGINSAYGTPVTLGANGTITFPYSIIAPAGTYSVFAQYLGDKNFSLSNSATVPITITKVATTVVTAAMSPNPATSGQTVTFTAHVEAPGTPVTPLGSVAFYLGSTLLAQSQGTSSGFASAKYLVPTVNSTASYTITANYLGDSQTAASATNFQVTLGPSTAVATTSTLSITPATVTNGDNINLTAKIASASGSITPTGTVTFYAKQTKGGSGSLSQAVTLPSGSGGSISFTAAQNTGAYPAGVYNVYFVYAGDSNHKTSTSNTVQLTINSGPPK